MSVLLFANNVTTTLSASILASDTSMTLVSASGLPTISGDQYYKMSLTSSDGTLNEIVNVTAASGATLTIVRGQEGTTAQAWAAGSTVENRWTAGSAQAMEQTATAQSQSPNYAVDTGTANHVVATFTPALTSHVIGMPLRVKIANANTGASDFNPGPSAVAITGPDGSALQANDLLVADVVQLIYNGVSYIKDPVGGNVNRQGSAQAASTAETETGTNATNYVTPNSFQGALASGLAGINSAITALQALQTTGVIAANGYIKIPVSGTNTLIIQWGVENFTPASIAYDNVAVEFNIAFPNAALIVVATPATTYNGGSGSSGGVIDVNIVNGMTNSGFNYHIDTNASEALSGVHTGRWIAIGY